MTRYLMLAAALLLAGCTQEPTQMAFWEHPTDVAVHRKIFNECIKEAKGPTSTHYNDLDEVVIECSRAAEDMARFCPPKPKLACLPQYQRSRADVREALQ